MPYEPSGKDSSERTERPPATTYPLPLTAHYAVRYPPTTLVSENTVSSARFHIGTV